MSADASPQTYTCVVCGVQALAAMTAECNWCDGRFHLNQRNDIDAQDCGQVWIDEQYLALQFACNTCLAGTDRVPAPSAGNTRPAPPNRASAARPRRYKRRA